jgi:hypothetical protein
MSAAGVLQHDLRIIRGGLNARVVAGSVNFSREAAASCSSIDTIGSP